MSSPARSHDHAPAHDPIDPAHARSWQLVTAAEPDRFDDAERGEADAIILDVEDGVPDSGKHAARAAVAAWLGDGHRAWVRINAATTAFWEDDLAALAGCETLAGVMLAKVESGSQAEATADRLRPGTPILALVESATGLEAAPEIARSHAVFRLAFGSGDFRRDTGFDASDVAMSYPRARLAVTSRAARIAPPIDGPTLGVDADGLRLACATTRAMGMTGKLCMHTADAAVVNEALSPSQSETRWAHSVIERLGRDGSGIRSGSERPQLAEALKITERAEVFGIA
ncbi:CoA ester lyase [Rhodococcus rhodnii]|uniref:Citryl-CoA lyase beta subunit n=2 Tax=Rhodococcus rhodnii TaxID=38312 RepID=R7WL25_9NOCA|nr:aldolase/citrate lyase family protein [Rhodococcus rhodnii]EOM76002.1 citryl-CoA lyase beta subunit [Rhodococcus rhodnii LMG 5362]TXG90843.1 CoA ester lyase [Rhodococcus rhodnii]